jgi:regulator of RNase E activity RraA
VWCRVNAPVELEPLPTAELADAAGIPIAMDARIRPVWRGARLAGPAFTVRTPSGEFLSVREAAEQAPAGVVIVVDGGGGLRQALWGDKMSQLAIERVSVVCGGVTVRPGDLMYGDADGVVVVPYEQHDEIVARVRTS